MNVLVEILGKQYKVEKGDKLRIPYVNKKVGEKLTFDNILYSDDGKTKKLGKPYVKDLQIASFRDFVELFFYYKEPVIHSQLYNQVKLISFTEGKITLNTTLIKDLKFNRNVARLVSKWTGRIWQIHSSNSNIGKSLYEEDLINQQKEIEKIKNHPKMKEILKTFPEANIHSITNITETNEDKDNNLIKTIERGSDG